MVKQIHGRESSLSAYLVNMAVRLTEMKRLLKPSGSIYLHCDPTASHYLKMLMDAVFGNEEFTNEIIWGYRTGGVSSKYWAKKHDTIFLYGKSQKTFTPLKETVFYDKPFFTDQQPNKDGKYPIEVYVRDVWDSGMDDKSIKPIINVSKERLGYPTQKPVKLLERIIKASSNEGELVLDPFCGCGTTLHAAETLDRQWVGVDVSRFAVEVVRKRLTRAFEGIRDKIKSLGMPFDEKTAKQLFRQDPWEFEKWVCGAIGARGLYKNPGAKGADGGIDGVLEFYPDKNKLAYAIVQVKGGHVKPNDVKALYADIDCEPMAMAGVFVCFDEYRRTADNHRSHRTFKDNIAKNEFPLVQVMTVNEIIKGKEPNLPNIVAGKSIATPKMPIMV